ncbi:MAG: glycosyltransferase family 4 protein [Acidobacteriota bacterium]|nr:MAG: glycosyltransferase family 4 protein [Acidobacteriota bacterium]
MEIGTEKSRVLIISNFYLPGSKSGGGTRTIVNTVERLSDRFEFRIITRAYDAGREKLRYENVRVGEWNRVGKSKVFYLEKDSDIGRVIREAIADFRPSLLYANSFFSPLTIAALRLRKQGGIEDLPFVLAPCGELSEGARRLKSLKKAVFIRSAITLGIYSGLVWKASSELEAEEIRALGARDAEICIAPDLPPASIIEEFDPDMKPEKESGKVRLVFVSRFDRKKNLKWIVENIRLAPGAAILDVYGAAEDPGYLEEFLEQARTGRSGIEVSYKGPLRHEEVARSMLKYHFKIMPTLGENFGHVFLEALSAGCPLIISDRTPWKDLEAKRAGWSLPLEKPEMWQSVLERCVAMEQAEFRQMAGSARAYSDAVLTDPSIEKRTAELMERAILRRERAAGSDSG